MNLTTMTKREILFTIAGVAIGASLASVGWYAYLHQRRGLVNDVEQDLDLAKRTFDQKADQYEEQLSFYESELKAVKSEYEAAKAQVTYSGNDQDDAYDDVEPDELEDDPVDNDADEPDRTNFVINDGNPRIDGILTDDEQRQLDEACGDDDLTYSVLDTIKRRRFKESINPDEPSYFITEAEHDDAPWFFTTEYLDYYETDDVLARGLEIVSNPDSIINPIVLNHFGKNSMSGSPEIVWCRNDILETDYQIVHHDGSYQVDLLGVPSEEAYIPEHRMNEESE